MAKYRTAALAEMQIGPILQEMSEIALRTGCRCRHRSPSSPKRSRRYNWRRSNSIPNSILRSRRKVPDAMDGQGMRYHTQAEDTRLSIAEAKVGPYA